MATCLVIDDVTVTRFAVRSFLEDLGVAVRESEDGDDALNTIEQGGVDVILLDWHLKKKSGIELLQVIRAKYGDGLKVVVFSGVEGEDKVDEALSAGANGFITKPTTKDKVEKELKSVGIL